MKIIQTFCFMLGSMLSLSAASAYFLEDFEGEGLKQWQCAGQLEQVVVSGTWQKMTARFPSNDESNILLYIHTDKGSIGNVWVDNFRSQPPLSSITNSSFEEAGRDWRMNTGVTLDDTCASDGRNSVRFNVPLESDPSRVLQRAIEVQNDTDYEISLDMLVDDGFQGDCKFLIFSGDGMRCIMSNHGEPFAANSIAARDRNGRNVARLKAETGMPVFMTRRLTLPAEDANINFSLDLCCNDFTGTLNVELVDIATGIAVCTIKPEQNTRNWQRVYAIGIARGKTLELRLAAEGQGTVDVDNISVTPPVIIPELQFANWMKASNNFVIPKELTVFFSAGKEELKTQGALELLGKDLNKLERTVRIVDAEKEAAVKFIIAPDFACQQVPEEGYSMEICEDGVTVKTGSTKGAFYGMMSILALMKPYGGEESLPAGDILDFPALQIRGLMTPLSPEECARKKLNMYLVSTGYPEKEADKARVDKILQDCHKYNLEPMPYMLTSASAYYVPAKNPNCSIGKFFRDEAILLHGETPVELKNPCVIRTHLSDISITSEDERKVYQEGRDYKVIPGDMGWPFPNNLDNPAANPNDIKKFAISRVAGSSIADGARVLASYDAVVNWRPPYCTLEPEVREINRTFFHAFMKRNNLTYVNVGSCLMEFHEADMLMKQDSRVIKSGRKPAELIAEDMIVLLDIMKEVNPDAKIAFFVGEVNDFCRQAAPVLKARGKDFIAIVWGYDAGWAQAYGVDAVNFWSSFGIPSVTMPWDNAKNVQGHAQLAKQAASKGLPCLGMIGSSWGARAGDIKEVAGNAWRVSGQDGIK